MIHSIRHHIVASAKNIYRDTKALTVQITIFYNQDRTQRSRESCLPIVISMEQIIFIILLPGVNTTMSYLSDVFALHVGITNINVSILRFQNAN